MTPHHHDLTVRHITGRDELDLFTSLPYVLNDEVAGDLAAGRRHPGWLWIARRNGRVVARAGWWSRAGDDHPQVMDIFDVIGDIDDGVRLLETALPAVTPAGTTPPAYGRFLPPDWRDRADTSRAVSDRMRALERVGAKLFVERLRLEWRPGTPSRAERTAGVPAGVRRRGTRRPDDLRAGRDAGRALPGRPNVPRIRAATDVGNVPMAAAFAAAGYTTFERQIDMTWQ